MCGIGAIFGSTVSETELRKLILLCGKKLRHRGPDWSGISIFPKRGVAFNHERLAIVGPDSGAQPIVSPDGNVILAVNGEIYNYRELQAEHSLADDYEFRTDSDCEVIIPLYQKMGVNFINLLRGMFSFILYDQEKGLCLAVRDHAGITPLYFGYATDGSIWFASELKAICHGCAVVDQFPPGHFYLADVHNWQDFSTSMSAFNCNGDVAPTLKSKVMFDNDHFRQWYHPKWLTQRHQTIQQNLSDDVAKQLMEEYCVKFREVFEQAVRRRMMADVPWGVLLSGGLDSSLVAAISMKYFNSNNNISTDHASLTVQNLHSFTIGIEGSPDLAAAQAVANHLGTKHHSYVFTIQEGLDAVSDVIQHLETYDVTTVRASTPMFLLSRKIKAGGIKMILSGEGADEIFGGYLYFHKAPNPNAFHQETIDKFLLLHKYDCLRANKSTSAWGLEARVPFLDVDVMELVMNMPTQLKMINKQQPMEKFIVRKAFDCNMYSDADKVGNKPYLPKNILWRQKEQFSDGVGYGWIDALKDYAEAHVTDRQMSCAQRLFPYNTPKSKEAYLYRDIFQSHYPNESAARTVPESNSVACSTGSALDWDESFRNQLDPSGRAVSGVHISAYK